MAWFDVVHHDDKRRQIAQRFWKLEIIEMNSRWNRKLFSNRINYTLFMHTYKDIDMWLYDWNIGFAMLTQFPFDEENLAVRRWQNLLSVPRTKDEMRTDVKNNLEANNLFEKNQRRGSSRTLELILAQSATWYLQFSSTPWQLNMVVVQFICNFH